MVETARTSKSEHDSVWPQMWEPLKQLGERVAGFFAPAADAATTDDAYQICVELPGVKPEDVVVELHDHLLTVKGEKRSEREEQGATYYFSERKFGAFHRAFRLPDNLDANDVNASYADGVLTIRVAKKPERSAEKVRIAVQTPRG